jgi:threonine synthase
LSAIAREWQLRCIGCGSVLETEPRSFRCPRCGNLLELRKVRGVPSLRSELFDSSTSIRSLWTYRRALPFDESVTPVSLEEGRTPLVRSVRIGEEDGIEDLYIKNEGQNPTGSFKDRGMTVAVTRALQTGAKMLVCASTGNTSSSLAAYASRAGVLGAVILPSGRVSMSKLAQAMAYGVRMVRVEGGFDDALTLTVGSLDSLPAVYLVNSINPYRIEGQKTVSFEIYEQLGFIVPDYVVLPVGNAGNISAVWKGFKELREWGITERLPRLIGVQAAGASPIANAFTRGDERVSPVSSPETVASAIRIGNPASWMKALAAIRESGGMALAVRDDQILAARRELAGREGIFVEAASATPVAALRLLRGKIPRGATVVCIATGHGLKDQEALQAGHRDVELPVASSPEALVEILRGIMA